VTGAAGAVGGTVAVVGGGISGLAAARRIAAARPDVDVIVLEASDRVGGKLLRAEVAGSWVDVGAEAMLARRPEGLALARDAGLADAIIHPLTTAALLRTRGLNRPLPRATLIGVPSDLDALREAEVLGGDTLQRIADEPGAPPLPPLDTDISVGDLVASRFGEEVVQRLVDPLLGGVYAGHAHEISLRAAVPALAGRLSAGGSLLEAAAAVVRAGATSAERVPAPVFGSLAGGLARLPETIAASGSITVRLGQAVRSIGRTATGFELAVGSVPDGSSLAADAVVIATPAGKTATMLRRLAPVAAAELAGIETASMVVVTLAFDPDDTQLRLPPGSGVLVPAVEGLSIKAMTFSSQKWPGVGSSGRSASERVVLMRASLGRAREEWALQREDAELARLVLAEVAAVTGTTALPIDTHVQRWGGGLPQYAVGHLERVQRVRAATAAVSGLELCGASLDGVGIPACIASAHAAADRVIASLSD
jgi:oxygen-dependent protoporphyrinogen oxidase